MKTIRTPEALRKHIEAMRQDGETDADLASRIGVHVNTLSKMKHSSAMFSATAGIDALGLRPVFEVSK